MECHIYDQLGLFLWLSKICLIYSPMNFFNTIRTHKNTNFISYYKDIFFFGHLHKRQFWFGLSFFKNANKSHQYFITNSWPLSVLKENKQWKCCHHLLTLLSLWTCLKFFLMWNTKSRKEVYFQWTSTEALMLQKV